MPILLTAVSETSPVLQALAVSVVAGVFLVLLSRRLKLSAIVFLLIGGVMLGPQFLGWVRPDTLPNTFGPIISLCVALILFEGGLSLNLQGYRSASRVIRNLLTFGVLVTWLVTAGLIYILFQDKFGENAIAMSLLSSSLVIVTGPTVIGPLLRRIRVRQNLNDILHWEGVLIDPIGVFIAILTYEAVTGVGAGEAIGQFGYRILVGLVTGVTVGIGTVYVLRKNWIPDDNLNIFIIAVALFAFALDDYLIPESGLLAVTVAGLVLGWKRPGPLKQIKQFKAEITDLLIGSLFVLLAAKLDFDRFRDFGQSGLLLVLAVMFVVRPLSIWLCTLGSNLTVKERLFLSYVAPRGIVAASMASLFSISLMKNNYPNAWFLVTFTFSVIAFTVILQGLTAGWVAHLLGLQIPKPTGWLIVGAHPFARRIGKFIASRGKVDCFFIDANRRAIADAKNEGLSAAYGDARDPEIIDRIEYRTVGNVLALTDNEELNMIICQRWWSVVGRNRVYRWGSGQSDATSESHEVPGVVVWQSLPKPSLVSSELLRGDITITQSKTGGEKRDNGHVSLMAVADGVIIDPARRKDVEALTKDGEALMLRREADYLLRSIRPEMIVRLEGIRSREKLFEHLIERALLVEPRIDKKELLTEIVEREKSFPTALGHSVAVPHGYSGQIAHRLCAVAMTPEGIDFDAPDGELVRLAFMVISPKGDPEGHLATMAEVARLVHEKGIRERLLNASDPADLLATLNASAKRMRA